MNTSMSCSPAVCCPCQSDQCCMKQTKKQRGVFMSKVFGSGYNWPTLQIVYIKINRHHKFLVHILIGPMGFIYSTGQWSKYFVTDQDLLISLLQRLFFIFTSDLELFDATLQLHHSTNSHLTAFLGRLLNRKYKDQWNFYCLHFCQN